MGLGPDARRLDREFSRKPVIEVQKRGDKAPVSIFLLPVIETEKCTIFCMFCGHPVVEIYNRVAYVSTYPSHFRGKVAADEIICKRCKQRYIKIV